VGSLSALPRRSNASSTTREISDDNFCSYELDHEDGKLSDEDRNAHEEILLQRLAVSQMHEEIADEELGDG